MDIEEKKLKSTFYISIKTIKRIERCRIARLSATGKLITKGEMLEEIVEEYWQNYH